MKTSIYGNILVYSFDANESTDPKHLITLPEGYSYETIMVISSTNISSFQAFLLASKNVKFNFPPINSHSPCTLNIYVTDIASPASLWLIITKFGQILDPHYFDKAFDPILVTGDDGNEYNVIASDQFK